MVEWKEIAYKYRSRRDRIISIRLPDDLLKRVDAYTKRKGLSRSQVIREAIIWYITRP